MSARITPLRLEAFEQLPKHARRCVFWEVDPVDARRRAITSPTRSSRRKPGCRWSCWSGDRAVRSPSTVRTGSSRLATRLSGDDALPGLRVLRAAAAPCRAPRLFPTGPVSADAVLLTSMGVESGAGEADGLDADALMAAVVGDLVRRGVRALEAFGRTADGRRTRRSARWCRPNCAPVDRGRSATARWISASSTPTSSRDVGFEVVAPHRYFPRLRLELEQGLGLEGRRRGRAGAAVGECAAAAARGCRRQPVQLSVAQACATRPACSTDRSCASSSANVNVPVGRSFLPSR